MACPVVSLYTTFFCFVHWHGDKPKVCIFSYLLCTCRSHCSSFVVVMAIIYSMLTRLLAHCSSCPGDRLFVLTLLLARCRQLRRELCRSSTTFTATVRTERRVCSRSAIGRGRRVWEGSAQGRPLGEGGGSGKGLLKVSHWAREEGLGRVHSRSTIGRGRRVWEGSAQGQPLGEGGGSGKGPLKVDHWGLAGDSLGRGCSSSAIGRERSGEELL